MSRRSRWLASFLLLTAVLAAGAGLVGWKRASLLEAAAASANQPEPMESITVAVAHEREHVRTTSSIGTVMALRSVTLRNELAGTVHQVSLNPGEIVDEGTLLVALDVSVEEAELKAQEAQAALAQTVLGRMQRASQNHGASELDVDRARAEYDVQLAQVARTKAIIAHKTILAPFRARVGMSDLHPGQYLVEGTELTTLQGVDDSANVDFSVSQEVAAGLQPADHVEVFAGGDESPIAASIVAVDARVDPATRNAMVRARIAAGPGSPSPGAAVRVRVAVGAPIKAVAIPVSALRKGPEGDHVFVVEPDHAGKLRARARPVESGAVLGDEIVIYSGLSAGEQVAASGSFKLRDGGLVSVAAPGSEAAH